MTLASLDFEQYRGLIRDDLHVTLVITCKKGGVGKTTLALNLAVALTALGFKVALIDVDPQGGISVSLDMLDDYGAPIEGIFDLLIKEMPLDKVVFQAPADEYESVRRQPGGELYVLPGGNKTQRAAVVINEDGEDYDLLTRLIQPLRDRVHFTIIDTAPSNALWEGGILSGADYALIPTQLNRLSVDGATRTVTQMNRLAGLHQARLLGILPTMVNLNTHGQAEHLLDLKQNYPGLVWESVAIPESQVWRDASEAARSIFSFKSLTNPAGKRLAENAMWAVAQHFLAQIHQKETRYGQ
ncbi:MAG: ParA family protein [Chloroflexi bacterium]|nr:ParA family protein [Chloroflexota bacterium]